MGIYRKATELVRLENNSGPDTAGPLVMGS
jgi:hypothetical protein